MLFVTAFQVGLGGGGPGGAQRVRTSPNLGYTPNFIMRKKRKLAAFK